MSLAHAIQQFPKELQKPVKYLVKEIEIERGVSHSDFTELKEVVTELAEAQKELAEAQKRTEDRVEELAEAQKRTEIELQQFSRVFEVRMGAIGARWGKGSERAFRATLREILKDIGYKVEHFDQRDEEGIVFGRPEQIELDVIIRNGKKWVLELKSSSSVHDLYFFKKKCEFYEKFTHQKIFKSIIMSPFFEQRERVEELAKELDITLCSQISQIDS